MAKPSLLTILCDLPPGGPLQEQWQRWREAWILWQRFEAPKPPLWMLGERLGISQERVRQLETAARSRWANAAPPAATPQEQPDAD